MPLGFAHGKKWTTEIKFGIPRSKMLYFEQKIVILRATSIMEGQNEDTRVICSITRSFDNRVDYYYYYFEVYSL
jgi:hypothetical protein